MDQEDVHDSDLNQACCCQPRIKDEKEVANDNVSHYDSYQWFNTDMKRVFLP